MENRILAFASVFFLTGIFGSCSDEDIISNNEQQGGDNVIQFTLSDGVKNNARTVYDDKNQWQLNWVAGDDVKIFSQQASPKEAGYNVTPDNTNKNTGKIAPKDASKALQWGKPEDHTFYAVYPDSPDITISKKGVATFPIHRNQICTYDGKNTLLTPDMKNAYMVAKNTVGYQSGAISLAFNPIMTTLQVNVQGRGVNKEKVLITGISVIATYKTSEKTATFNYDIAKGTIIGNTNSPKANEMQTSTFVGINNLNPVDADGETSGSIALAGTETITFTAFMPPVPTGIMKTVKIRVHSTEGRGATATIINNLDASGNLKPKPERGPQIAPSSKRIINMPPLPNRNKNNWITPLDDDIYVSQLSIPGTHDSCTGDGTTFEAGRTQELSLGEQWDRGIRAFDIRPRTSAQTGTKHNLWVNHGKVSTNWSFDAVVDTLEARLKANPREFAIILMRHEEGDKGHEGGDISKPKLNWEHEMSVAMNDYKARGLTVDFKPDLTIADCRGKILFLSRNEYFAKNSVPQGEKPKPIGGFIYDWVENGNSVNPMPSGKVHPSINRFQTGTAVLEMQDYYQIHINPGTTGLDTDYSNPSHENIYKKQNAICDLLDLTSQFHIDNSLKNTWAVNHFSGYLTNAAGLPSNHGYEYNSRNVTKIARDYLLGKPVTINGVTRTKPIGPTGIVMMDYVGARISTNDKIEVGGDLCTQIIIDNNYKYLMRKKGDEAYQ